VGGVNDAQLGRDGIRMR